MGSSFSRYDVNKNESKKIENIIENIRDNKKNINVEFIKSKIDKTIKYWKIERRNLERYHPSSLYKTFLDILNELIELKEKKVDIKSYKNDIKVYIQDFKKEIKEKSKDLDKQEKNGWNKILKNLNLKYKIVYGYF